MPSESRRRESAAPAGWRRVVVEVGHGLRAMFAGRETRAQSADLYRYSAADVHDQSAFAALADLERKRAERAGYLLRVLLVQCADVHGAMLPMASSVSTTVLTILCHGLRVTDTIGWYRDGWVVGALLTMARSEADVGECHPVHRRLIHLLSAQLLADGQSSVQIRLYRPEELPPAEPTS